jgi:hypothetical protein
MADPASSIIAHTNNPGFRVKPGMTGADCCVTLYFASRRFDPFLKIPLDLIAKIS